MSDITQLRSCSVACRFKYPFVRRRVKCGKQTALCMYLFRNMSTAHVHTGIGVGCKADLYRCWLHVRGGDTRLDWIRLEWVIFSPAFVRQLQTRKVPKATYLQICPFLGIGFVSQTPWIQQCSVRENILFGTPYDATRYKYVPSRRTFFVKLLVLGANTEIWSELFTRQPASYLYWFVCVLGCTS